MNFGTKVKECDLFGRPINFFYNGNNEYTTRWGCFITGFVLIVFMTMTSLKFVEFFGDTDPIEYFILARQDPGELINLTELGFTFAVEDIDESIGWVEVS